MKRRPIDGNMRQALIERLKEKFGPFCWYCGIGIKDSELHLDHINPVSSGGRDNIFNLALACKTCNRAKWDLPLLEFFEWIKHIRNLKHFPLHLSLSHLYALDKQGDSS